MTKIVNSAIFLLQKEVKCDCGKRGCLEALSSGSAIEKFADNAIPRPEDPGLQQKKWQV